MERSIFDISAEERFEEQEAIKAELGLKTESKVTMVRLNMTLPPEYKTRFLNYCEKHYLTPSAQLRAWIDECCD